MSSRTAARATFSLGIAVATALGFGGCAATSRGDVFLSPLYVRETSPSGVRRTSVAYPFFEEEARPDGSSSTALHPFFRSESAVDGGYRTEAIYPLGLFSRDPETRERIDRIVPLFSFKERVGSEGFERDWFVFPIVFAGESESGENYFTVFPFYGHAEDMLTLDEIDFVLFPLYVTSRDGEYETVSYVWPLTLFGEGGGRETTRVLPFWAHTEKEGVYEQTTLLWPFFHHQRADISDKRPSDTRMLWPLYGQETTEVSRRTTVLWPFFSWGESDAPGDAGGYSVDAPWPVYMRRDAGGVSRIRIWPFTGSYESEELESRFFLWPLIWDRSEKSADRRMETRYVIPFGYRLDVYDPGADEPRQTLREIWPLAKQERDGEKREFRAMTLEPGPVLENFDENYGFLYTLYRRREDRARDAGEEEILLGLYRQWWEPGFRSVDVPFLFHLHERENETTTSFLWGLLRLDSHAGGTDWTVLGLRLHSAPRAGDDADSRKDSEP